MPNSILIVKTSAIGDVIQTFPVLEYLRTKYPDAQIDWVVEKGCQELLCAHPQLDRVLTINTKKWRRGSSWHEMAPALRELRKTHYDLLFDLQGNSKSALVTLCARAKEKVGFGWKTVAEKPAWFATKTRYSPAPGLSVRGRYLHLVQSHFGDTHPFVAKGCRLKTENLDPQLPPSPRLPCLMVCFGSRWKNKQLPFETLKEFLLAVHEKQQMNFLFIWGNPEEGKWAKELASLFPGAQARGNLSLPAWQALMHAVTAIFAVDSAGLHLAGTTSTPTFSVFGPSSAAAYQPPGTQHASFQGTCPYHVSFSVRCPHLRTCPTGACLRSLSPQALLPPFSTWWQSVTSLYPVT